MKQSYMPVVTAIIVAVVVSVVVVLGSSLFMRSDKGVKFAVVNLEVVISESEAGKTLTEWDKTNSVQLTESVRNADKVFESMQQQLEGKKSYISDKEYEEESQAIREKRDKFQQVLREEVQKLNKAAPKYSKEIVDKAVKIIKRLKTDREFKYVLNARSVVGHDSDLDVNDITGEVTKRLNEELPSINITEKFDAAEVDTLEE